MFYNFLCDIDNLQEPSTTDIMLSRIEKEIPKFVQVRLKYRSKFYLSLIEAGLVKKYEK